MATRPPRSTEQCLRSLEYGLTRTACDYRFRYRFGHTIATHMVAGAGVKRAGDICFVAGPWASRAYGQEEARKFT
jgi:hypothetical protein